MSANNKTPLPRPPSFLPALFDSLHNDEQGWLADCPICDCPEMTIRPNGLVWRFTCPDGCSTEEVAAWLNADVRLWGLEEDEQATRGWGCLMLATTPEQYQALLEGRPVVANRLNQKWFNRFRQAGLI